LLVVDSGYALIAWPHVAKEPPTPLGNRFGYETAYLPGLDINQQRKLWCSQKVDATTARHVSGTVNVGWIDGHVDRRRPVELQATKTEQGYDITPTWRPADN
jgi:prepilin-type processing-associated H-X9-DG protein